MSNITRVTQHLPDNIQDLSKFVLVGREKLVAVRAEIRAIDKLNIAEEVRTQKREEAQMLSEALLDAEVRIGELLKQIPTASGARTDLQPKDSGVPRLEVINNTSAEKTKSEVLQEIGFTEKQKQRFETLASNKDIVEQVKVEARENEDIPTRSRVLQLVKEKNKPVQQTPDFKYHAARSINEAIGNASTVKVDQERLACWIESLTDGDREFQLMQVDDAINNLHTIKAFLTRPQTKAR